MSQKMYWCERCQKQHILLFQQALPYAPDPWWYTVGQVLLELAVLLVLIIGAPFLVWLLMSPRP